MKRSFEIHSGYYCPECGEEMEILDDFHLQCPECLFTSNVIEYDEDCKGDDGIEPIIFESIPEGCAACGGPYPECKDSCNLFDE